jgi:hypothetical protein
MELSQSPGRKPLQQSPAFASLVNAALAFMVLLPTDKSVLRKDRHGGSWLT